MAVRNLRMRGGGGAVVMQCNRRVQTDSQMGARARRHQNESNVMQ